MSRATRSQAVVHKTYTWIPYLNLGHTTITASATMRLEAPYNSATSPYSPNPGPSGSVFLVGLPDLRG